MTLHRQANISRARLTDILEFCAQIPAPIKFFAHHRIAPILSEAAIPQNIHIYDPCPYSEMVSHLAGCRFIITDSGGLNKTAPFFGKKALILREKIEWIATEEEGWARRSKLTSGDIEWILEAPKKRNKRFYLTSKDPSLIIYESIKRYVNDPPI